MTDNLPASRDTELALLGCIWQQPDLLDTLGLQPGDFWGTDTEALYQAITTLHNEGVTPDPIVALRHTPKQQRDNVNQLLIQHIITSYAIPSNAAAHAAELRDLADRRAILAATDRLRQVLADPDTTPEQLDDAIQRINQASHDTSTPQSILERYPALNLADLLRADRPPREFVIEGLIPARASISLIAPAGVGKSLLSLGIAISVSQGKRRFAGFDIPRPRRVLYIDKENTPDDLAERFEDYGLTPDDTLDGLTFINLPDLPPLDTPQGGHDLAAILDAHQLQPGDLLILDSHQRMIEGPENDADTMRAYYRHTAMMLKRRELTVLRLDNTGKDVSRRGRGSSAKQDDVDVELVMTRDADDPDLFHIEVTKGRLGDFATKVTISRDRARDIITWSTANDPQRRVVNECKAALAELQVPLNESYRGCLAILRTAGRKFVEATVRTAVRERKSGAATPETAPESAVKGVTASTAADVRQDTPPHHTATPGNTGYTRRNNAADHPHRTAPQPTPGVAVPVPPPYRRHRNPAGPPENEGERHAEAVPERDPDWPRDMGSETPQQREDPAPRNVHDARSGETSSADRPGRAPRNEGEQVPGRSGHPLNTCRTCHNPTDPGRTQCHKCAQNEALQYHQNRQRKTNDDTPAWLTP